MGRLAVSNNSTQQIRPGICFVQSTVSNLFALDVDVFCLMPAQGRLGTQKEVLLILKTGFHQHSCPTSKLKWATMEETEFSMAEF